MMVWTEDTGLHLPEGGCEGGIRGEVGAALEFKGTAACKYLVKCYIQLFNDCYCWISSINAINVLNSNTIFGVLGDVWYLMTVT